MIDSHCHLEAQTYGDELASVLDRAREAGVRAMVAVGAGELAAGAREAVALAQREADVYAAVGIHPNEATQATADDVAAIETLLAAPKVVALGEVGLDYHYSPGDAARQKELFVAFIAMAKRAQQPLMLHVRDAHEDCLALLDAHGPPAAGVVVHCFTGTAAQAQAYQERGFYLSIAGVATFKNAASLREAVQIIAANRLLIETDSPYLAPVPMRGKRNEPAFVAHTAAALAALRGVSVAELAATTTANAQRLFRLSVSAPQRAPCADP